MNVADQSALWMHQLETRKRKPASRSTLATYGSNLKTWILPRLGQVELADLRNGILKDFVAFLSASGLSPASIILITNVVKSIVASAVNDDGEQLYVRNWNSDFLDVPELGPGSQKQPHIMASTVEKAIRQAEGPYGPLYAVLAGTGLRIGEALALRYETGDTVYIPSERLIQVRTSIYRNVEQARPKTASSVREIDLSEKLNEFLTTWAAGRIASGAPLFQNVKGGRMHVTTAREVLAETGIRGFHCFRRFRLTRLRGQGVPEDIVKFWIGHADKDITDRYSKLSKDVELRREWVEKAGLGFKLEG